MSGEKSNTPRAGGAAASLRDSAQQLTALYEREAYRVYNLALRIACDRGAAARATEQAFVAQAGDPGSLAGSGDEAPAFLLASTVQAALRLAPRRPRTEEFDDPDSRALLAATATLRGPERAALALSALAHAAPAEVAWALDVTPERAAELRERATTGFHEALGVGSAEAEARVAAWPWADPPAELWERIYPQAYSKLERALSAAAGAGAAARAQEAEAAADASRRAEAEAGLADMALLPARLLLAGLERVSRLAHLPRLARPTSLRGWLVRVALPAALIVALGAVALDTPVSPVRSGDEDGGTAAAQETAGGAGGTEAGGDGAGEGGDEYDPLTPEELDELRQEELEDLSRYAREQQRKAAEQQAESQPPPAPKPPKIKPPKFGGGLGGGGLGGGGGSGGSGGGGSGGGGNGGGSSTTPPPDSGGDSGDSGGGSSGGSGGSDGGSGGSGGGNGGGGGSNGGGGGGSDDGETTLDECIRDTETGAYICPDPKRTP